MVRIQPDPPSIGPPLRAARAPRGGAGRPAEPDLRRPGVSGEDGEGYGGLAQLGEHLLCKQGVVGSIPSTSTKTPEDSSAVPEFRFKRSVLCLKLGFGSVKY